MPARSPNRRAQCLDARIFRSGTRGVSDDARNPEEPTIDQLRDFDDASRRAFRGGSIDLRAAPSVARDARLLDCLDLIYRAAEQPGCLSAALARLAELVGASSALVLAIEGSDRRLVGAAHASKPAGGARARLPVSSQSLRTVPLAGGFELVLERDGWADVELATLVQLAPHLGRALRLADRLGHHAPAPRDPLGELDRLPLAVVLLSASREVLAINRTARGLLAHCTALAVVEHRLVATKPAARALLETLIERVTAPPDPDRRFVGGRLELDDAHWQKLELLVLRAASASLVPGTVGAVLLSASGAVISAEQRFRELFALDEREACAAVDLLVGRSPAAVDSLPAATDLVRSIYRKVGTTRQADLVQAVLRSPGVLFEPS